MKFLVATIILVFGALIPCAAEGKSLFIEVTPTSLKAPPFTFEVTATANGDSTFEFRIQIMGDAADFRHSSTSLGFHRELHDENGVTIRSGGERQVEAQRKDKSLVCEFTVKASEVEDPAFTFFLTKSVVRVRKDGREMVMPSADFYYLSLKKFIKQ